MIFDGFTSTANGMYDQFIRQQRVYQSTIDVGCRCELGPQVAPAAVVALAEQAAGKLWPRNPAARQHLVPLFASIARAAQRHQQVARFRLVRTGARQRVEPEPEPPPADGEWPADAVVVATERDRFA